MVTAAKAVEIRNAQNFIRLFLPFFGRFLPEAVRHRFERPVREAPEFHYRCRPRLPPNPAKRPAFKAAFLVSNKTGGAFAPEGGNALGEIIGRGSKRASKPL